MRYPGGERGSSANKLSNWGTFVHATQHRGWSVFSETLSGDSGPQFKHIIFLVNYEEPLY